VLRAKGCGDPNKVARDVIPSTATMTCHQLKTNEFGRRYLRLCAFANASYDGVGEALLALAFLPSMHIIVKGLECLVPMFATPLSYGAAMFLARACPCALMIGKTLCYHVFNHMRGVVGRVGEFMDDSLNGIMDLFTIVEPNLLGSS
jgi:hypothetical protein